MFISDMPLAQLQDELDSIPATELEDMRINLADTLMEIETTLDVLDMVDDSMVSKTGLVPLLMLSKHHPKRSFLRSFHGNVLMLAKWDPQSLMRKMQFLTI